VTASPVRPVLGLSCCTRWIDHEQGQSVMNRYLAAAMRWGDAAALLVPALPDLMSAREVAVRLDGLLLTGSPSNLRPARYGEGDALDAEGPFDDARDAMVLDLIGAMIDLGRPVFGVCRGFQEINVAFGGALRRDVGCSGARLAHHAPPETEFDALFDHVHEVELTAGGLLHRALKCDRMPVVSVHFQGLGRLGAGLAVEARAPDGLVEGVSAWVDRTPVLAVQWHPEWQVDQRLQSQAFFGLLGQALRGELAPP